MNVKMCLQEISRIHAEKSALQVLLAKDVKDVTPVDLGGMEELLEVRAWYI